MRVINFFGGPGSGKSTASAGLFYIMKKNFMNVELVTEFAKDLVYENNRLALSEQNYVFANQNYRLFRLSDKVDYVITDSPLLLSTFYASINYPNSFYDFCLDVFNSYENINFFIERNHIYSKEGRFQNEEEADMISEAIKEYLKDNKIHYKIYKAGNDTPEEIFKYLKENYEIS